MTSPLWNVSPQIPIASSDIFQDFIVSFNLIYFISILKSLNASGLISSKNSILLYSPAGETLIKSLIAEIIRLNRKPSLAMSMLSSLFRKAPSPLSYSSIGRYVSLFYKTVRDYLDVLDGLMILNESIWKFLLDLGGNLWIP